MLEASTKKLVQWTVISQVRTSSGRSTHGNDKKDGEHQSPAQRKRMKVEEKRANHMAFCPHVVLNVNASVLQSFQK